MIRARIPRRDDMRIVELVKHELLPYTLKMFPGLRWNTAEFRRRLNGNVTFVVVPGRSKAMGFISVIKKSDQLFVDLLAVDRRSQGRGYGSALLREAERYARVKGCRAIRLYVDEANHHARLFYAKHGFVEESYIPSLKCWAAAKTL